MLFYLLTLFLLINFSLITAYICNRYKQKNYLPCSYFSIASFNLISSIGSYPFEPFGYYKTFFANSIIISILFSFSIIVIFQLLASTVRVKVVINFDTTKLIFTVFYEYVFCRSAAIRFSYGYPSRDRIRTIGCDA